MEILMTCFNYFLSLFVVLVNLPSLLFKEIYSIYFQLENINQLNQKLVLKVLFWNNFADVKTNMQFFLLLNNISRQKKQLEKWKNSKQKKCDRWLWNKN